MAAKKSPQALAAERRAEVQREQARRRALDNLLEMRSALDHLRTMCETQEQAQMLSTRIAELVESDDSYCEAAASIWLDQIWPKGSQAQPRDEANKDFADAPARKR